MSINFISSHLPRQLKKNEALIAGAILFGGLLVAVGSMSWFKDSSNDAAERRRRSTVIARYGDDKDVAFEDDGSDDGSDASTVVDEGH